MLEASEEDSRVLEAEIEDEAASLVTVKEATVLEAIDEVSATLEDEIGDEAESLETVEDATVLEATDEDSAVLVIEIEDDTDDDCTGSGWQVSSVETKRPASDLFRPGMVSAHVYPDGQHV